MVKVTCPFCHRTEAIPPFGETAEYTGLSVHTLYKMVNQRRIPYVKVGSRLKFDIGLLDGWLKQNTVMPMPAKST